MKSEKDSMLAHMGEYVRTHWKWLFFIIYIIAAILGWNMKLEILSFLHIDNIPFLHPIYKIIISAIYLLLGTCLLICILKWVREPVFLQLWYKRGFENIGFKNSQGMVPILKSRRKDKRKTHGLIYEFDNVGLSVDDFENSTDRIQTVLNGTVYRIAYSKKRMSRTFLYVLPKKYALPTVISLNSISMCSEPNLLCVGKTGAGKSYALATMMGIFALHIPEVSITICDYKKSSFAQFEDTPNFFGYQDVPDGVRGFYKEFQERLAANDSDRNKKVRVLLIDEYGALIAAQDKKLADELKMMIANMLFMGRSLGIKVLIGVQRADSEHFRAGARDQFRSILALGNLSKEQKLMLFADDRDSMTEINDIGEGYLFIDGKGLERVKISPIRDSEFLNESIRKAMYH